MQGSVSRLTLAALPSGKESHVDEAGSVVCGPVRDLRVGARGDRGVSVRRLTQAEVDEWLAEHRPDFVPVAGVGVREQQRRRSLASAGCVVRLICAPRLQYDEAIARPRPLFPLFTLVPESLAAG